MTRALSAVAAALSMLATLSGCGVGSLISDYMSGEDDVHVVSELVQFAPTADLDRVWSTSVGDGTDKQYLSLEPAVSADRAFIASHDGDVAAVELANGRSAWQTDTDKPISGGPGLGAGLVVVGTSDGSVLALGQDDGKERWRASVTSEVLATPAVTDALVVVRTGDGKLFGLNASDGKRLWVYDRQVPSLTLRGTGAPVIAGGLIVAGLDNGRLVALEPTTGKVVWEATVTVPRGRTDLERMVDIDAAPVYYDGVVYVATFQGQVAAVTADSGQILWSRDLSSHAGISVDEGYVYVADDKGDVWALDRATGASAWRQEQLAGRELSAPAVVGDYVVVGDLEGYLHWLRADDGQFAARARLESLPILVKPRVVGDLLIAYGTGGELSAYRAH